MARPKKKINEDEFKKLCSIQCTLEEIAGWYNCSERTIERFCRSTFGMSFVEVYKKYSVNGKISLRRSQFKLAEKSAAMAIFLGKNYLGQTDKTEIEDTTAYDKLDEILKGLKENATNEKTE